MSNEIHVRDNLLLTKIKEINSTKAKVMKMIY